MRSVVGRRVSASVIAGVLLLVSCSSDDSVSEELVSATVAVEETTTTAATTMSTIASTTTSTSTTTTTMTTTVPATTTTTTEPEPVVETVPNTDVDGSLPDSGPPDIMDGIEIPVNTMFDPATPEGEVEQAVLADNEAYKICLRDLQNCDVAAATSFTVDDAFDTRDGRIAEWKDAGLVVENADSLVATVTGVSFGDLAIEVEVQVCVVDDTRFVVPAADGAEEIVAAEGFLSFRRQYLLIKVGGQWLVAGRETRERADGAENSLCA